MSKMVTIQAQQRWDYCCESRRTENALLIALNELGQVGWELVSTQHHKDPKGEMCWTAFLKRPNAGVAQAVAPTPASQSLPGQSSIVLNAPPQPAAPAEDPKKPAEPQGFDLSGDEFPLKGE